MSMTDPISDLLTRIRNAQQASHSTTLVPATRLKLRIVEILKSEGYINEFELVEDGRQGLIHFFCHGVGNDIEHQGGL